MAPGLRLLLRLEARRLSDAFRHPRPAAWLGILLPLALAAGGLWVAGESVRPDVATAEGVVMLGMLVAGPVAIQTYPILFRPVDDAFLRRLGISAKAVFGLRALRLLALTLSVAVAVLIPFVATGQPVAPPLAIALSAGVATWSASLLVHARAAGSTVSGRPPSIYAKFLGPDVELVKAASLVYAPLGPLLPGAVAGLFAVEPMWTLPLRLIAVAALSLALVPLGAWAFARALPRFAPHAGELAWAPPPDASGGEMVIGRGIASMLPLRVQAVRARDALVVGRRYRWAQRLAWPVAIVGALAVLRAGGSPGVRAWVTLACGAMLAAQAAAIVALGRSERGRTRWTDRTLGLGTGDRLLGRWATAFGLALAVALPVAAAWWIAVEGAGGWPWLAAAAGGALVAAAASVAAAGR